MGHLDSVCNSEELRKAFNNLLPEVTAFYSKIPLNTDLWKVIKAYSSTGEAGALTSVRKRFLEETIKDFKEGLTFESAERAGWSDVNDLSQIDVVVTLADNPTIARWWIEQMEMAVNPDGSERFLLAATSAAAAPFLQPYRDSQQLDGLIAGINGAAAIEAGRKQFGSARQMLDSQSIAHLFIVVLIVAGTIAGWMPPLPPDEQETNGQKKQSEETG